MESERLSFREISAEDAEIIVRWRSDYNVYKYFLSRHKITLDEHLNWYKNIYLKNSDREDYIAEIKLLNKPVGVFGLVFCDDKTVEINYLLDKKYQGKGYASEAVKYLICYSKKLRGCKRVVAEVHKDNISSIKLVKKLGFAESNIEGNIVLFEKKI